MDRTYVVGMGKGTYAFINIKDETICLFFLVIVLCINFEPSTNHTYNGFLINADLYC